MSTADTASAERAAEPERRPERRPGKTRFALLLVVLVLIIIALGLLALTDNAWFGPIELIIGVVIAVVLLFFVRRAWTHSAGPLVGEARKVSVRQEFQAQSLASYTIWSFRVDRYDSAGNRLDPVSVEMRGLGVTGSIDEGDQVEVVGRFRRGKPVRARAVRNLTTGTRVRVRIPIGWRIAKLISYLIYLGILVGIVYFVYESTR